MTGPHGLVGTDLDGCVADDGTVAPWAQEIVDALASYTEISPSGHWPDGPTGRGDLIAVDRRRGQRDAAR